MIPCYLKRSFRYFSCLGLLLCLALSVNAQTDSTHRKRVAADCDSAVSVGIFKRTVYGPVAPPQGYGKLQEIRSSGKNSATAFEQEHNSSWHLLTMAFDGEIVFEITPADSSNDYDFLLYPCKDSTTFCTDFSEHKIAPVRSNIRRNEIRNKGVTGLRAKARHELQGQGPGEQFSRSLTVHKGEQYMLVLDNVYDSGKGYTLNFNYIRELSFSGTVVDETGKPLQADIVLADKKGDTVQQTRSGQDGKYEMKASIYENTNYSLTILNENNFLSTATINTKSDADSVRFTNIRTVLPKLRKGNKYKVGNINFWGGSYEMLPESYPSVRALSMLMRKNKKMTIRVEGHVNAPGTRNPSEASLQELSEQRADAVRKYLIGKGIAAERIATIGYAATQMLYPKAAYEPEQSANRRVEINILSMGD